jgi:hypothetical protein
MFEATLLAKQRLRFIMLWLVEVPETFSSTFPVAMLSQVLLLIHYIGYLMAFATQRSSKAYLTVIVD